MPESQYRARQVSAKTQEVVEYDHDDSLPGKPLHILIPGGLVALASLGVIILVAYLTWSKGELPPNTGLLLIALLAPFYVGGVFLFSYGYELYNDSSIGNLCETNILTGSIFQPGTFKDHASSAALLRDGIG